MLKEAQIEEQLIQKLKGLKYIYRPDIRSKAALEQNFRQKFNALNRVNLTDLEFDRLREQIITPDVFAAANRLRHRNTFEREDGTPLHYTLVNIKHWCKNEFEVINQLRINTADSFHRYDVILLINGLPVVQIELKAYQVSHRKAMEQIVNYKSDPGNGFGNSLLCFMQLFIVSNGSHTFYFANNNKQHFAFNATEQFLPVYELAREDNTKVHHLYDFADAFLTKCNLGQMISRYIVLVAMEQKMLVMRPYQIYAVKAIVACIKQNRGNGYIWHTTGSGKTLTSFKASTLLKDNPNIEKCFFVVDRKDLDRQTRQEFNKFQEGCVEGNTNTEALVQRMLSTDYADKVIVTTIQKLGLALDEKSKRNKNQKKRGVSTFKERLKPLRDKRVVFIFDECHRSQFGENHKAIKAFFPKAQLFGFTGTPIFEENATYKTLEGDIGTYKTTKDIFEKELHAYTITNAIDDRNVLKFHVDYFKPKQAVKIGSNKHKIAVVNTIIKKHGAATNQRRFNAILATASINDAIAYVDLFKTIQAKQQATEETYQPLNVACVFSPPAEGNRDIKQIQEDLPQEKADNAEEPNVKKEALKAIIADYNQQYGTNHSIHTFDLYYQNVQQRIKDQKWSNVDYPRAKKIDVMIVVDMLLTGFDSKYLNTMYVDKNLKHHGLIQAFSRTNRVLNDSKPYGNILDFRQQKTAVDTAIQLFSGKKTDNPKEIWMVDEAPVVIEKYKTAIASLTTFMEGQGLDARPEEVHNLKGDLARAEFTNRFKEVQRLRTQLDQYTNITTEQDAEIDALLPEINLRSFKSVYLETAKRLKAQQEKGGDSVPTEIHELDFEFVLFASAIIDYDYIMGLIAQYTQSKPSKHKMTRAELIQLISSYSNMMEDRDNIIAYIDSLAGVNGRTEQEVKAGYEAFKKTKATQELNALAEKHGITAQSLTDFVGNILYRMIFDGELLVDLLAPLELGWRDRMKKELALMEDLVPLLKKRAEGREIAGLAAYE